MASVPNSINNSSYKEIIIFAKSLKHGGFCIAGKCTRTGQWIRTVNDEQGGAIPDSVAKATNSSWEKQGKSPYPIKLLTKITMCFSQYVPCLHQQENWLNNPNVLWKHNYSINRQALGNYLDQPENIWIFGNNIDRVSEEYIGNISNSLCLIKVKNLTLHFNSFNKRRASFDYHDIRYDFSVTDTQFDELISNCANYPEAILCISLGERYLGNFYKIVATIFI